RSHRGRGLSRLWLCARRCLPGRRGAQARRGSFPAGGARPAGAEPAAMVGRELRGPRKRVGQGARRAVDRPSARWRPQPDGRGRAARC
nr:hypothetical protein [Tanacetum cinerariifolium]